MGAYYSEEWLRERERRMKQTPRNSTSRVPSRAEAATDRVESIPSSVSFVVLGAPVAKPRQTRSDKWKKRPCVVRYREWADRARSESRKAIGIKFPGLVLMACSRMRVMAFFPIPPSWTKPVKAKMKGQPHRQSKDADNVLKAVSDALFPTGDAQIYDMHVMKFWDDGRGPRVEITMY